MDMSSTTVKKSFTINKDYEFEAEFDNSLRIGEFELFTDKSTYFDKFFLNHNKLYHQTAGLVYTFENKRVNEINSFVSDSRIKCNLQELRYSMSFYTVQNNTLFEFWIRQMASCHEGQITRVYCVEIKRIEFAESGHVVSTSTQLTKINYNYIPYIFLVNNRILISNTYTILNSNIRRNWRIALQDDSAYDTNSKSIIYRLDKNLVHTIYGTIDFNVVSERFVVVFTGQKFVLIDIVTNKVKMDVTPEAEIDDSQQFYVTSIMKPRRIIGPIGKLIGRTTNYSGRLITNCNSIQICECTIDGKYKISNYTMTEDVVYKPESDECIHCYKSIARDCVIVPCGNRQYCEDCAAKLVVVEGACAKCNVKAKEYVKIIV